ncbi:hypothetical protein KUTeg_002980 [Tegillarca granosa]|uniref:Uncharacterized protein n=1 Tax=Tegillarca granosa TaxID=220873 RepID=A0ABQ9FKS5_TEGGR|nr:hypothetical protein KUTeg_002980 [Tegillarca granosa]
MRENPCILPPSEIRFTQDSIGTTFGRSTRHAFQPIGETLDDLLKGRCSIYTIPSISVTWKKGKVYSADNRRLWICKKAEALESFNSIPVREIDDYYISSMKRTTVNKGESLYVRGDPGGSYWKTLKPRPIFKHHIIEMRKNEINRHNQAPAVDINTGKDVSIKGDDKEKEKTDKVVSEEKQKINNSLKTVTPFNAVVNIDIETNKHVDYSFNVQNPKRKSCCVRNIYTILTFVISCIKFYNKILKNKILICCYISCLHIFLKLYNIIYNIKIYIRII